MSFNMTAMFRDDLPDASTGWSEPPRFSFVGGHNDAESVPFGTLAEAAVAVMKREGKKLATYNLGGSPLGYLPLRQFVCDELGARASLEAHPEEVLVTSGSLQALDLVNSALLKPGETVVVEQATYGGMIDRLNRLSVRVVGVDLDENGMDTEHLAVVLADLEREGHLPKYIYTIPTVQNPTGSVLTTDRRHRILELARQYGVAIFEDDCYADLVWDGSRPPSIRSLDGANGQVIYCGSFSKSIAPALRVGYLVADEAVVRWLLALKTDAGTGALEQLTLAEFGPSHFEDHVERLTSALEAKCETMVGAVRREFGQAVTLVPPKGGIYVWLAFPDGFDTGSFAGAAAKSGIEFNPGSAWSSDPTWGANKLRLCFGHADDAMIDEGVAELARIYHDAVR